MNPISDHKEQIRTEIIKTEKSVISLIKQFDRANGYAHGLSFSERICSNEDYAKIKSELSGLIETYEARADYAKKNPQSIYPLNYENKDGVLPRDYYEGAISGIVDGAKALNNIDLSKHLSKSAGM